MTIGICRSSLPYDIDDNRSILPIIANSCCVFHSIDPPAFSSFTFSLNSAFLANEGPQNAQPSMQAFQLAGPSSTASKPAKRRRWGPNVAPEYEENKHRDGLSLLLSSKIGGHEDVRNGFSPLCTV